MTALKDPSEIALNHNAFRQWLDDAGLAIDAAAADIVRTKLNLMELDLAIKMVARNWLELMDEMGLK
jgi:hypothetical protein